MATMKRLFPLVLFLLVPTAFAEQKPPSFADLAERLLPTVVNISTTQEVKTAQGPGFPPGSPFDEFFRDFFNTPPGFPPQEPPQSRKAQSLGVRVHHRP